MLWRRFLANGCRGKGVLRSIRGMSDHAKQLSVGALNSRCTSCSGRGKTSDFCLSTTIVGVQVSTTAIAEWGINVNEKNRIPSRCSSFNALRPDEPSCPPVRMFEITHNKCPARAKWRCQYLISIDTYQCVMHDALMTHRMPLIDDRDLSGTAEPRSRPLRLEHVSPLLAIGLIVAGAVGENISIPTAAGNPRFKTCNSLHFVSASLSDAFIGCS